MPGSTPHQYSSNQYHPQSAYDLYCGTGNFALYLSTQADRVTGVDSSRAAIADARINAALNEADNTEFIHARSEDITEVLFRGKHPKTVFLNPPRKGCSRALLDSVAKSAPTRIVYISCNPATLAQPVDMFPHTSHVETVVLMSRVEK